jgi:hypothetical protein
VGAIKLSKSAREKVIRFFTLLGIVFSFSFLSFSGKTASNPNPSQFQILDYRKDNVPWPWGKEIEFPWREAPGVYSIRLNEQQVFLTLNVVAGDSSAGPACTDYSTPSPSYVAIKLVDATTCASIGFARGFKVGHLIRAQFVNQFDNEVYTLSLHTFDESIAKMSGVFTNSKDMVMVASVELLKQEGPSETGNTTMTSPLIRIASPSGSCNLVQKKLKNGL